MDLMRNCTKLFSGKYGLVALFLYWQEFTHPTVNGLIRRLKLQRKNFVPQKSIIAIEPWGSERTSLVVKENADRVVKWNTESVVFAIRELA